MPYTRSSKEIELNKQMMQLKKDHEIAEDPYQKDLILEKWKSKVKEYAEIINEIKKKKN